MVEKKIESKGAPTVTCGSCDLILMVRLNDKNEDGKAKTANVTTSIRNGTSPGDAVSALSAASVQLLVDLAGKKKKKQAKILAAYMEKFVGAGVKIAGKDVMDKISEKLTEE